MDVQESPVVSAFYAVFSDLSHRQFLPPDPQRKARYVLGKVVGDHVNLTTFDWHPDARQWESACGRIHYRFLPEELSGRGFEIMEELGLLDPPLWDCRDYFGARMNPG